MNQISDLFPNFGYLPAEILKYIETAGIFRILLRNGISLSFEPKNVQEFHNWLKDHNIENLKAPPIA